jgi:DDE_Tnp_1-associated
VLPSGPGSLWHWLGQLPDPRDPRGVRFSLPCVIAIAVAARLAGRDSFTAAGEWAASRPQRVLRALGCPRHKRAGVYVAPSEKTIRRVSGLCDHDRADDLLCGWTGELAACGVLSPARLQERRRDKARKAKARARKAARRERGARELSRKQARKAARRERKAAAAAIAAAAQAVAGVIIACHVTPSVESPRP